MNRRPNIERSVVTGIGIFLAAVTVMGIGAIRISLGYPLFPFVEDVRMEHINGRNIRETTIGRDSFDDFGPWGEGIVASPDLRHVAYRVHDSCVAVDLHRHRRYDAIVDGPVFSPDSTHVVYIATSHGQSFAVFDGAEGKHFDAAGLDVFPKSPHHASICIGCDGVWDLSQFESTAIVFSPDSTRLAFPARDPDGVHMIVDNQPGPAYPKILSVPIFSADSRRVAYVALTDGGEVVVVDGVVGTTYGKITTKPDFSPDGLHIAYIAMKDHRSFVVRDGVEQRRYAEAYHLAFSPDSRHLAYVAVHDVPGQTYDPDVFMGDRVAVVDEAEGPPFHQIQDLAYSPDGRLFYVGSDGSNSWVHIDHQRFDAVFSSNPEMRFVFSRTGKRFAFVGRGPVYPDGRLFIDGVERTNGTWFSNPRFSDDEVHVIYGTTEQETSHMYFDDQLFRVSADSPWDCALSPQATRVVYPANRPDGFAMVLSGIDGISYDDIVAPVVTFDAEDRFHYIARRGRRVLLVEETVEPGECPIPVNHPQIVPTGSEDVRVSEIAAGHIAECEEKGLAALDIRPAECSADGSGYSSPGLASATMGGGSIGFEIIAPTNQAVVRQLLADPRPAVRVWTAYIMISIGDMAKVTYEDTTLDALRDLALHDTNADVRRAVLSFYSDPFSETEPHLDLTSGEAIGILQSGDLVSQEILLDHALRGRCRIRPADPAGEQALCETIAAGLKDEHPALRRLSYETLCRRVGNGRLGFEVIENTVTNMRPDSVGAYYFSIKTATNRADAIRLIEKQVRDHFAAAAQSP